MVGNPRRDGRASPWWPVIDPPLEDGTRMARASTSNRPSFDSICEPRRAAARGKWARTRPRRTVTIGALALAPLLLLGHAPLLAAQESVQAVQFTPIVLSGQIAPGTDAAFARFEAPVLNESGELAFHAALSVDENGSFASWGLWGPTQGLSLGLVALEGDPAPGTDVNERFSTFSAPYLGNQGRLGFVASLTDAAGGADAETDTGIWAQLDGEQPRLVAREGSPAPGTADGTTFGFMAPPLVNGRGCIAFRGALRLPPAEPFETDGGIWASSPTGLDLFAREGDLAVGVSGDTRFDDPLIPLHITDGGETYFEAGLNADGSRIATHRGLYRADAGGAVELLLRTGEPSPGLPVGEVFAGFEGTRFNERGDLATVGITSTGSGSDSAGIFVATAGEPPLSLARSGEAAPGAPEGSVFDFFSSVQIDAAGRVAFAGRLDTRVEGIWGPDPDGGISLYLLEGDAAPGLPEGVLVSVLQYVTMNDAGDLVFTAGLGGTGIDPTNDSAIYFASDPTRLIPVIAEGWDLEVLPGDFRTVAELGMVSRSGFNLSALGSERRLAFSAKFTDGSSGVFVAEVPASTDLEVGIDIRPRSASNLLNLRSRGRVPVALLGSEEFDVAGVDVATLAFGPEGAAPVDRRGGGYADRNRDGFLDLVRHFRVPETGIRAGDEMACLNGVTLDGIPFTGCDAIETLGVGRR